MRNQRTRATVGLSIEPGLIAAAQVSVNGSIRIEDGGHAPLGPGVVPDGDVADADALAAALRALWRDHKGLSKHVRIGVANARIVVRTLYLPPITDRKELANAVRFQASEAIPMPMNDAVLDFQAQGIVEGPDGPRQQIVLVAARRDMIEGVLNAARSAGLKPVGIDLSAFGMVRALARQRREGDSPELFVAIGGLTNLAISQRGICAFTRIAGGGLEGLAAELAERRELTSEQARIWLYKARLEGSLDDIEGDRAIAADARAVLAAGAQRIAAELRATLDFHRGQADEGAPQIQNLVLTGPVLAVPGFAGALADRLELEIVERVVSSSTSLNLGTLDAACLSVAAGLAVES